MGHPICSLLMCNHDCWVYMIKFAKYLIHQQKHQEMPERIDALVIRIHLSSQFYKNGNAKHNEDYDTNSYLIPRSVRKARNDACVLILDLEMSILAYSFLILIACSWFLIDCTENENSHMIWGSWLYIYFCICILAYYEKQPKGI